MIFPKPAARGNQNDQCDIFSAGPAKKGAVDFFYSDKMACKKKVQHVQISAFLKTKLERSE
jgi:hypothetical protein